MQDSHVTRAGAQIAYELTGSGPTLGYAHGVLLSRAAVRRLISSTSTPSRPVVSR